MFSGARRIIALALTLLGVMISVSPETAQQNVVTWLSDIGWRDFADYLQSRSLGTLLPYAAIMLFAVGVSLLFRDLWAGLVVLVERYGAPARRRKLEIAAVPLGSIVYKCATLKMRSASEQLSTADVEITVRNASDKLVLFEASMQCEVNGATSPRGKITMEGIVHAGEETLLCYDRIIDAPKFNNEDRYIKVCGSYHVRYWSVQEPRVIRQTGRKFGVNEKVPDVKGPIEFKPTFRLFEFVEG